MADKMSSRFALRVALHVATVVCLTVSLQGCQRETAEKFIASGKSFLTKHDYSAAAIQFKNAVNKAPDNAEARYLLGIALEQQDDPVAAEIELRKAISAGYAPDLTYPALVRTLLQQRLFEKALSESTAQQNAGAAKAELLALSGEAQLGLGKVQDARVAYSAALAIEASNDTAALGMARLSALGNDLPRANQLVDEVLSRTPSSRDALLLKGDLLLAANHAKDAAQAYGSAIDLRPQSVRVYLKLVPLLLREKDLEGAKARIAALKKAAPSAVATSYLDAMVAYTQADLPRAHEAIQATLQAAPEYPPALLLAGTIALDLGSYAEAEEYLRKVVGEVPTQPYPRRLLVLTYLRSGQLDRAQEALDPLLSQAPGNASVLALAGEVALARRDIAKASTYYQKALALEPKNALTRMRLGQARLAGGDTQSAIQDLEAASSEDGSQYQADVALVVLYLDRKDLDKAQAASDALTRKQSSNPLAYNVAGMVRLARHDQSGARKDFEQALRLQPTFFPAAHNLAVLDAREQNFGAAAQRYEGILAKDSKNEQALLALVNALQVAGAPRAEVEQAIDRAVQANPASARARLVKINYLLSRADRKGALSAAQQAHAALPQDRQVLTALGVAQLAAGENDQAIATFGKLGSLSPQSPAPLLAQGQAYAETKDWASAAHVIRKALELQPDVLPAWLGLVRVEIQSRRFSEARNDARTVQSRWPAQPAGYLAEAEVLIAQKDWRGAERATRDAVEKTKSPESIMSLYALLEEQGRKQEAEALVVNWAAQNAKDILVYTFAGDFSMQRKDYAAAARWYRAALRVQPNSAKTLNNLAWVLGQVKDPSALEYGQKALALTPDAPTALDTVGWLYVERGDVVRGLELLNKAHTLAPDTAAIEFNLARALIKAGQGEAARQHLDLLARLPAGSPYRDEAAKLLSSL